MRTLITGGAGMLGSCLAARQRGQKTFVATRKTADLLDKEAVLRLIERVRPSLIYHLAGTTKQAGWDELWKAHVGVTLNLLGAASRLVPGARVVVIGSSAEYGDPGPRPVREDHVCEPFSLYGSSKLSQTTAALSFFDLDVRVARVTNAVGAGTPAHLAAGAFARQIARCEKGLQKPVIEVGDLTALRDFIDVDDVAAGLEAVAARGKAGEVYNVGSGRAVPVRTLLSILLSSAKRPIEVRSAKKVSHSGGLRRISADISKLRRAAGWTPRVSLEDSLRATLDSWRRKA